MHMLINSIKRDQQLVHSNISPYFDRFIQGYIINFIQYFIIEYNLKITYSQAIMLVICKILLSKVI